MWCRTYANCWDLCFRAIHNVIVLKSNPQDCAKEAYSLGLPFFGIARMSPQKKSTISSLSTRSVIEIALLPPNLTDLANFCWELLFCTIHNAMARLTWSNSQYCAEEACSQVYGQHSLNTRISPWVHERKGIHTKNELLLIWLTLITSVNYSVELLTMSLLCQLLG